MINIFNELSNTVYFLISFSNDYVSMFNPVTAFKTPIVKLS